MTTLSIRMPEALKKKTLFIAKKQGVSMNNFIICSVSSAVAQQEAYNFFDEELKNINREKIKTNFNKIINKSCNIKEPDINKINKLIQ
jgi:hypothetical protein